jgi:hypothetical protein
MNQHRVKTGETIHYFHVVHALPADQSQLPVYQGVFFMDDFGNLTRLDMTSLAYYLH